MPENVENYAGAGAGAGGARSSGNLDVADDLAPFFRFQRDLDTDRPMPIVVLGNASDWRPDRAPVDVGTGEAAG